MKRVLFLSLIFALPVVAGDYQGQLTVNPYIPNAISPTEARPQYGGPSLYNSEGEFRGKLNNNRYDSNSISNPYGQYGSKHSTDSINNPYGAGSRYKPDSPNNPYGTGWSVYDD